VAGSIFGSAFRISTFGESHGKAIGVIIDGCPAGLDIDEVFIQAELDRRKPGQSAIVTQRKESDTVQILSGVFEGKSTGTPIGMLIPNGDQRSHDYGHIADKYRPSHADFTYQEKIRRSRLPGRRPLFGAGNSSPSSCWSHCQIVSGAKRGEHPGLREPSWPAHFAKKRR